MIRKMIAIVVALSFAAATQAGVSLDVVSAINSNGNWIHTVTATSDGAPISSLGVNAVPFAGSSLGQVHPSGFETSMGHYNPFFGATPLDHDTQALFSHDDDLWFSMSGPLDTEQELNVNFTGFTPFMSRAVAQVVVIGEGAVCTIGAVAGGVEYTNVAVLIPEPASVALLAVGTLALIHRR